MEDIRLPLPAAYGDPAFKACLDDAVGERELVKNFDRLYGASLGIGKPTTADCRAFAGFVHDCIYLRLPADAIHALRLTTLAGEGQGA